jgi:hypothetical protein
MEDRLMMRTRTDGLLARGGELATLHRKSGATEKLPDSCMWGASEAFISHTRRARLSDTFADVDVHPGSLDLPTQKPKITRFLADCRLFENFGSNEGCESGDWGRKTSILAFFAGWRLSTRSTCSSASCMMSCLIRPQCKLTGTGSTTSIDGPSTRA